MSNVKVVFGRGDLRIELEGEAGWVKEEFDRLLALADAPAPVFSLTDMLDAADQPVTPKGKQTIRSFMDGKAPRNVYEKIACVLYHLRQSQDKPELSVNEIRDGLRAAGVKPPGAMNQALVDCRKNYGYIENGTQRGFWKLTHNGEAMVEFDLPPKPKN